MKCLEDAVHLMWHRLDALHEDGDPDAVFPPQTVEVTSDDLLDKESVRLAECVARDGHRVQVFVRVDADDETLTSYGGSPILLAASLAAREDYLTARDR